MTGALDAHIGRFNIVAPAILAVVSIILAGTAIKTASFFGSDPYRNYIINKILGGSGLLSFDGLFTFFWASAAVAAGVLTLNGPFALVFSPLARLATVAVLWVLWLAGAAALTDGASTVPSCDGNPDCNTLKAAEAFGWIGWILLTFMLAVAIYSVVTGSKSQGGLGTFGRSGGNASGPAAGGFTSGTVGGATQPSGLEMGQVQQPVSAAYPSAGSHHTTGAAPQQPYPTYDRQTAAPQQHHDPNQQQFAMGSPVDGATSGPAPSFPEPTPHTAQPTA